MSAGARQKPRPRLNLAVQYAVSATGKPSRAQFRRWVNAALEHDARITLRIVGQAEGLALNHNFRAKAYATNVLTFDYQQSPIVIADLVLCAPVVAKEAKALGKTWRAHYAHLLVHGTLHAQGWDHETSNQEAQAMEALEVLTLHRLGIANPYR